MMPSKTVRESHHPWWSLKHRVRERPSSMVVTETIAGHGSCEWASLGTAGGLSLIGAVGNHQEMSSHEMRRDEMR